MTCLSKNFSRETLCLFLGKENMGWWIFSMLLKRARMLSFSGCFFYFVVSPSGEVGTPSVPLPCHLLQLFRSS
ncbi:hypothetical protein ACFX2I_029167 [Malus domestica]